MKTFVVLGMHRSATSLAAKGLYDNNVHMGDYLLGKHPSNPYGHWEDREFIALNDAILTNAGGSWDDPPAESEIIAVGMKWAVTIEEFVRKKEKEPFWGWKDPRTTLTIQCYIPFLVNPHYFVCVRNPKDVAESLRKRNGMSIDKGLKLAGIYNSRLLSFLARQTETRFAGN